MGASGDHFLFVSYLETLRAGLAYTDTLLAKKVIFDKTNM